MSLTTLYKRNILYSLMQLPRNSKIAIYGNGMIGRGFRSLLNKNRDDITIVCYINSSNPENTDDLDVILVDELNKKNNSFDTIIVCSSHWNEIEDELSRRGLEFIIISNQLIFNISELSSLGSFRFETHKVLSIKSRCEKLFPSFDTGSLEDFKILMDLRLTQDETAIFSFFKNVGKRFKRQYIDNINLKNGSTIIEGGVEDGTDSVNFYNAFNECKMNIYGFEPFIEVFDKSPNKAFLLKKGIKVYPWALWNKNEDLSFIKNDVSSVSSCINRNEINIQSSTNKVTVRGISIDSFVEKYNIKTVSLIKLDIEGAELEALQGAAKTISKYKPQLAISIYHKKEDLFEIPELLLKINPEYKFKLGMYSPTFIDSVLYALP
jgi:FkbM family methyltransferase